MAPLFDNLPLAAANKPATTPTAQQPASAPKKEAPAKPAAPKKRMPPPPLGMSVRFGAKKPPVVEEKKEEKPEIPKVVEAPVPYGNAPVSQLKLNDVWEEFANKQERFLKQTLSLSNPTLKDETLIILHLENSFQHDKLKEVTQPLMSYLKKTLQNDNLKMEVQISAALESTKAFTPKEKLELLIKDNPALGKLISTFGLEMD